LFSLRALAISGMAAPALFTTRHAGSAEDTKRMGGTSKRAAPRKGTEKDDLERQLDQALAATFPASDPISVGQPTATEPPARPADRKAPLTPIAPRRAVSKARG
jgi:hypothetical protein